MCVAFSFCVGVSLRPKRGGMGLFASRFTLTSLFSPWTCTSQNVLCERPVCNLVESAAAEKQAVHALHLHLQLPASVASVSRLNMYKQELVHEGYRYKHQAM